MEERGCIVRKYWTKARPKPAWYTPNPAAACPLGVSFKGFGWLPLQHCCLQHRCDSAVCSLLGGWLGALVSPPPHQSRASSWQKLHRYHLLLGLLKPRRKNPETSHSLMPPKLVPCRKYLKIRRPAFIPFVHSSSFVMLLPRHKQPLF